MGIVNRTMDASEQKELINENVNNSTTGVDYPIYVVPRAMNITDAKLSSLGLSGTPTCTLKVQRFIAGSGNTTISISTALTQAAFGTSGYQTFSLPATGSSLLSLQKGDMLTLTTGGAASAVVSMLADIVVQNLQDVRTWY